MLGIKIAATILVCMGEIATICRSFERTLDLKQKKWVFLFDLILFTPVEILVIMLAIWYY